MEIYTNSPRVMKARKMTLELMLSTHDKKCLSCVRSENCELQKLCRDYGVEDVDAFEGENPQSPLDETTLHMVRDNNKCILCRRCVAACEDQFVGVIGPNGRGFDTHIGCAFEKDLGDVACVSCGQCIVNCPTGALREKDQIDQGMGRHQRSDEVRSRAARTRRARRAGRGIRYAHRHQRRGQNGCRSAPPGL